jgi:type I restriction enzyme S subunit
VTIKYGKDHKKLNDGDVPVYGSGGVMRYVDTYLANDESVLIPRKGTLNNVFYVKGKFWTVDTLFWTQINKDIISPKYLYYCLKGRNLAALNVGSAVPSLTIKVLENIRIDVPNLFVQKSVVEKISVIEQKMQNNDMINDNLSVLIDEIYRNMIKISELKETNIDKIGSVVGGGTPSTKKPTYWGGKIPWLSPKDLSQNPTVFTSYGNKFITRSGLDNSSAKILPPKTILFSSRAPIGYISISKNKLATNQGFKSIIPDKGYPYSFIYELIKNEITKLINESNGSTFKEISSKQLKQHVISIPCKKEINLFDNKVNKLFKTIQVLESETTTLNNLKKQLLSQFLN